MNEMVEPVNMSDIHKLAGNLLACAEDAKRPVQIPGFGPNITQAPDHRIVSLANAVEMLAKAMLQYSGEPHDHQG